MDFIAPIRSELKTNIIISLLAGEKNLSELKSVVNTRETTILHVLKEFERLSLTTKSHGVYRLTPLGLIEANICKQYYLATETLSNFKEFWLTHDTTVIPVPFLATIGALKDASLITPDPVDLDKVHETFIQSLISSKKIIGISPFFHPDFIKAFKVLLNQGSSVQLLLTDPVLKRIISSASPAEKKLMKTYLEKGTLKFYQKEDLKIALTITDTIFSLGLYSLDGIYDNATDLVAFNKDAIDWGEALFKEYIKDSWRIGPDVIG